MASHSDDVEELSWWDSLKLRPGDEDQEETIPPLPSPPPADDSFNARERVQAMFGQPPFGESGSAEVPTLRSAGSALLRFAGLFGTPAPPSTVPAPGDQGSLGDDEQRPPSWKLPGRSQPGLTTILGDDTALAAGRMPAVMAPRDAPSVDAGTAPPDTFSAAPGVSAVGSDATSPLDHPDAHTGLALTAADALIRRGAQAIAGLTGGNRALAQQAVSTAVEWIARLLPPEYQASAAKTGEAALADAAKRLDDDVRSARTRAVIGTLAGRRAEAERDHAQALIEGDPVKLAEARRDLIDAWRAERRARGDGEAEINAGARALEAQYRRTTLQHRLAQMDEAGLTRAVAEDEDAKADPGTARAVADEILRTRRDDPARAGQASIEREIAQRKRDGRVDTAEEETAARYRLRLDAQARRGIPEGERRLLTNDERAQLAGEYHRIESSQGKAAADRSLEAEAQRTGPHAERFKIELGMPRRPDADAAPTERSGRAQPEDRETGRVETAQQKNDVSPPASPSEIVRHPPQSEVERSARDEAARMEAKERTKASPDDWTKKQ